MKETSINFVIFYFSIVVFHEPDAQILRCSDRNIFPNFWIDPGLNLAFISKHKNILLLELCQIYLISIFNFHFLLQLFEWWYFKKYGISFIEQVSLNHLSPYLGWMDGTNGDGTSNGNVGPHPITGWFSCEFVLVSKRATFVSVIL